MVFQRSSMGVWGKFQRCLKEDSGVFWETFKGGSRVSDRSSNGISKK